jgi:hypothetical protein
MVARAKRGRRRHSSGLASATSTRAASSNRFLFPMSKLILLSLLFAMIWIPARAAREKNPRKALRKVIVQMLIFEVFYLFALRFLYGRFG